MCTRADAHCDCGVVFGYIYIYVYINTYVLDAQAKRIKVDHVSVPDRQVGHHIQLACMLILRQVKDYSCGD